MPRGRFAKGNNYGKLPKDLTGLRFGRLLVICRATPNTNRTNAAHWQCLCNCGNTVIYRSDQLQTKFKSCGCIMQGIKLPFGEAAARGKFAHIRATAIARNLMFHLTLQQFKDLSQQSCYYCGTPPSQEFRPIKKRSSRNNGSFIYNGIDRLDSDVGYTIANCVPACKRCNYAKQRLSLNDFLGLVVRIYNHHNLGQEKYNVS